MRILSSVVLPDPERPRRATNSPGSIRRSMPRKAYTMPPPLRNSRVTLLASTIVVMAVAVCSISSPHHEFPGSLLAVPNQARIHSYQLRLAILPRDHGLCEFRHVHYKRSSQGLLWGVERSEERRVGKECGS